MKINWGYAMVFLLVSFMVYIISFMVRINISELVSDEYYSQGVNYQSTIEAENNYFALNTKPIINYSNDEINVLFPLKKFNSNSINGTIELFRPSDAKQDIKFPIILDEKNVQRIPTINLEKGKYYFILDWQSNNTRFRHKQSIKIK
jgi:hypothetical protein